MSIEKLSPSMRSCILELQYENVVGVNMCKTNKKNNINLFNRILKVFI